MASQSQAGPYYGGTDLIRSTAGKVPALKVQFPLRHNTAIERDGDRIVPLTELEIEMLKTSREGGEVVEIYCEDR